MRPSLRFLALAIVGWAGLRAATLGALPGAEIFSIQRSEAKAPPPPIVPTQFPPIEPVDAGAPIAPYAYDPAYYPYPPSPVQVIVRPVAVPAYYRADSVPARPASYTPILPDPGPAFYAPIPRLDDWPLSRIASASVSPLQSTVASRAPIQSAPANVARRLDRLQMSAWALLRGRQGEALGPGSLASGGQLGGSQAGARVLYNFDRQVAASLRTTSEVGRRGGEVAAGLRIQPVAGLPLWFTAERRQRLGSGSGRNAFALFAESGLYQKSVPLGFSLDAYLQGGVVGFRSRDMFVDGGLTFSRPLYRRFSGGFGLWGGAQPGVYRVDAGPRLTMAVRDNVRVHLDWRQRLAGNAEPGSGPAITLAGDF